MLRTDPKTPHPVPAQQQAPNNPDYLQRALEMAVYHLRQILIQKTAQASSSGEMEPKQEERDDLTTWEKAVNIILFGVLLIMFLGVLSKIPKIQSARRRKNYRKLHNLIIMMIFVTLISR